MRGSALYGSDAVGGVANLLLCRDYDGLQTSARVGASTDGGNVQQQNSGVGGRRRTGGGFMVAIDYSKATPITANQRDYARSLDPSQMIAAANRQVNGELTALATRRQRLIDQGLAETDAEGTITLKRGMLAALQRREFLAHRGRAARGTRQVVRRPPRGQPCRRVRPLPVRRDGAGQA